MLLLSLVSECWRAEGLECWSAEVLRCWSSGVLKFWRVARPAGAGRAPADPGTP